VSRRLFPISCPSEVLFLLLAAIGFSSPAMAQGPLPAVAAANQQLGGDTDERAEILRDEVSSKQRLQAAAERGNVEA